MPFSGSQFSPHCVTPLSRVELHPRGQDMEKDVQNKIILAALGGLTATSAAPAQTDTFDGPYIGVQAGWSRA